ncbi:XRE family transcriptional regulator [Kitasatospora sp. NPDC056273]|uniref:XRE family transcriptional regulator n=1 Tax=Kitasatospora sp. NPDC056273 TaxID=3345769 RepID=UPI0035E30D0C
MPSAPVADDQPTPSSSVEQWRRVRGFLNDQRYALTGRLLVESTPGSLIPGTPLLARQHWIPEWPVPLEHVRLSWKPDAPAAPLDGGEPELDHIRPHREDGTLYRTYAEAVRDLAKPRLFENRNCYRLLDVEGSVAGPRLTFGRGRYFDVINICEAAAHEYAAAALASPDQPVDPAATPFRTSIADPTDLLHRPVMAATSTLTIRSDRATGEAEFVLHWRDPEKVASGGGLYQVMPVGMFQASHDAPWNEGNDFDLWRAILRELSEELLGGTEDYGSDRAPIDYAAWPLNKTLTTAREHGRLRVFWLGLGMDPLTFVTDMLTVAVFDADLFDETFQRIVSTNDEGHRVGPEDATGCSVGIPFTAEQVDRLTGSEPMQPAGAALLRLAWQHREALLGEAFR